MVPFLSDNSDITDVCTLSRTDEESSPCRNVTKHLVLDCSPCRLYVAFPALAAQWSRFNKTSVEPYSCTIHNEYYTVRVDLGACLVDRNKSEIRFVVHSHQATPHAELAAFISSTIDSLGSELSNLKFEEMFSCHFCMRSYFHHATVHEVAKTADPYLECEDCKRKLNARDLMEGYQTTTTSQPKLIEARLIGIVPGW